MVGTVLIASGGGESQVFWGANLAEKGVCGLLLTVIIGGVGSGCAEEES